MSAEDDLDIVGLRLQNARLARELSHANKKWQDYEHDYILPCFVSAREAGIDLPALVRERPGHNCVDILVRELIDQRDAARSKLTRALPDHKVIVDFLRESFPNDGAEGESVHMACAIIERLSAEVHELLDR